jgi:hypothetical protein
MSISFFKIPILVDEHFLFDILLPKEMSEHSILIILTLLSKIRQLFYNEKNIDRILSEFLDCQPFTIFNYLLLKEKDNVNIVNPLKMISIGDKKLSLNNQEHSDFYFHTVVCIQLLNYYK